jgi:predicted DNA-binding protein with PD1-like motif
LANPLKAGKVSPAGRAFGGHLAAGAPVFACEFVIREGKSEKVYQRALDEETGLFLWAEE